MVRRRLTLKRIDPWSVLKFGFVANLSLLAIGLLGAGVVWFFVQRLELIGKVCEIATEMGFVECGVNGGNLFRALFLLGLLGVVIQTGLLVFLAFLYNLIADLVGGLSFSFVDDTPGAAARGDVPATQGRTAGTLSDDTAAAPRRSQPRPAPDAGTPRTTRSGSGTSTSGSPTSGTTPGGSTPPRTTPTTPPRSTGNPGGAGTDRGRPDPGNGETMWGQTRKVDRPGPGGPSSDR